MLSDRDPSIGVVGLGLLGTALCQRLIRRQFAVMGFDIAPEAKDRFLDIGGQTTESVADLIDATDIIFLSLPNGRVTGKILSDNAGHFRRGQIVIDTTTSAPEEMRQLGQQLGQREIAYLEANVAGSSQQVLDGTASILVGGEANTLAETNDILDAICEKRFHVGGPGMAARFKLVHNLILGLHRAVLAEGLCFGTSMGLDPTMMLNILRQTPAASEVMNSKGRKMIESDFSPQAKLSQHLKDVRLILDSARLHGVSTPLSELHASLLQAAEASGFGNSDNSAIIEVFRAKSQEWSG